VNCAPVRHRRAEKTRNCSTVYNGVATSLTYSKVLALCTLLLVVAGGLVTSNDAALSIPDWPLSWGRVIPVLEGGIRYEFAHRTLALLVTVLAAIAAWRMRTRLAYMTFAAILSQAALGVFLVKFLDPKGAAVLHAALAQLCFGLTVMLCIPPRPDAEPRLNLAGWAAIVIFLQTVLGAAARHGLMSPASHAGAAVFVTALVMWAALRILISHMDNPTLRRPAMALLSITFSQVFLGIGAWMARAAYIDSPQPMPLMVLFTVAHVAVGSLAFGAAIVLAMVSPSPRALPQEGMAAA
jgi:cytochrome c oxidase assembly protein subunit 15